MSKTCAVLTSAALALSLFAISPTLGQTVDFGEDTSRWANDGQCDDPRFEGPGAAAVRVAADEMGDATDCRTAFEAGTVTLAGTGTATPPATEPSDPGIDFGDDSGSWANDGECDDPRFGGALESHARADASDCRAAYEADPAIYTGESDTSGADDTDTGDIDFGDDSGSWANDGECDDPRFGGTLDSHLRADATDCRTAYEAGEVTFAPDNEVSGAVQPGEDLDFGDDSGSWANDGECDDPRFGGSLDSHRLADASDCRAAYEADPSIYTGGTDTSDTSGIDFGDDSGNWANDGECDDPRFGGALENHRLADASDCRAAYEADPSIYAGDEDTETQTSASFNFGDDSGDYAGNGVCDDPRFEGPGSAEILLFADRLADATDCSALYHAGEITFAGVTGDPALAGANEIDFGDDTSEYANNERCDDPRFAGPGTDILLLQEDRGHDASDCQALFASGEVWLAGTNASDTSSTSEETADAPAPEVRINFGDDSGAAANDGICDDPRFQGRGAALELLDTNLLADASDCRAAYDAGTVTYQP